MLEIIRLQSCFYFLPHLHCLYFQVLAATQLVRLIICTHRCSDLVVFKCLEAGVALVAGVDVEEAQALCRCAESVCPCVRVCECLRRVDVNMSMGKRAST